MYSSDILHYLHCTKFYKPVYILHSRATSQFDLATSQVSTAHVASSSCTKTAHSRSPERWRFQYKSSYI